MPTTGTLTKARTAEAVVETNGYIQQKAHRTIEILLELIKRSLEPGEDVLISGFGKFCVKKKPERRGRYPATGKDLILAPRKVVTFKWSGKLNTKPKTRAKKRRAGDNKKLIKREQCPDVRHYER